MMKLAACLLSFCLPTKNLMLNWASCFNGKISNVSEEVELLQLPRVTLFFYYLSNNAKHSALNIGKIINLYCKLFTFSWVWEGPYFAPEHRGICQICTFLTHLGNLSLVCELIKYNSKYAPMPTNGVFIPLNLGCGQLSTQKGTLWPLVENIRLFAIYKVFPPICSIK